MKDIPNKIFLQVDPDNENPDSFNELNGDITWCRDRINDSDIPFFRKNGIKKTLDEMEAKAPKLFSYLGYLEAINEMRKRIS